MAYTGSIPDTAARPMDWMRQAACVAERATFDDPDREYEARTICVGRCPVRTQCLAYVKEYERGLHRDRRDGVTAGLTHAERFRLDPASVFRADDPGPITFDGSERCGTHHALLRHLWLDEPIDPQCWSGKLHRDRDHIAERRRTARIEEHPEPVSGPAPDPEVTPPLVKQAPAKGSSPHERRVYRLWEQGFSDMQIARRMAVSVPQVQRVRDRLGLLPHMHLRSA
ncbi:WhiB family transcriptional regulator [Streptomyces sp. NPDC094468]|uniref:WhiB family transcriptional regulator n=1 Tax=Streptomyces sp. NPDC094468 TaxID=3366066 RepID=UPI00381C83F1